MYGIARTEAERYQRAMDVMLEFNKRGMSMLRDRGMPESVRAIVKEVAERRGISLSLIASASRFRSSIQARNEAMYLIRAYKPMVSSTQLGKWFDRDHTSVLHGIASWQEAHGLPKLVGYDLARVRQRNAENSQSLRDNAITL